MKTVEAVDDQTVKFTLNGPNSLFLENLIDPAYTIMPKHLLEGIPGDELTTSDFVNGKGIVGSGPYKLTGYTPDQAIEYTANPNYFKGAPHIAKLIFRLKVSPDTAAAQLLNGELGIVMELKPSDYDVLRTPPASRPSRSPASACSSCSTYHPPADGGRARPPGHQLWLRSQDPPGDRVQRRRLAPLGAPGVRPERPQLDHYEFNPDKAKQLLAAAESDGKYDPQHAASRSSTRPSRPAGTRSQPRSTTT